MNLLFGGKFYWYKRQYDIHDDARKGKKSRAVRTSEVRREGVLKSLIDAVAADAFLLLLLFLTCFTNKSPDPYTCLFYAIFVNESKQCGRKYL